MADMVNHPGHYEKKIDDGLDHPECIDLLDFLVFGYSGIAAGCVMQFKYCYRAGSKAERGLTLEQKTAEDFNKVVWYMKYYQSKVLTAWHNENDGLENKTNKIPWEYRCQEDKHAAALRCVANEFIMDKPTSIRSKLEDVIIMVACMKDLTDIEYVIDGLEQIIGVLEVGA